MKILSSAIIISCGLLTACGGGSSSSGGEPSADNANGPRTGVLLDSPVANIGYRTYAAGSSVISQQGVTNDKGEYTYLAGESVTFFIGALEFPATTANGVLTPLDLADTTDPQDTTVVNMLRLLQTLDKDGDPDNGITITDGAKAVAVPVNFNLNLSDFAASAAVTDLISNGGQDTSVSELISGADALAHFESQLNAAFNNEFFALKSFAVDVGEAGSFGLSFDATGTGIVTFPPSEDNGFDEKDFNPISWSVNGQGQLLYRESDVDSTDYWDWVLTPATLSNNNAAISISVSGMEDGQPVTFNEVAVMNYERPGNVFLAKFVSDAVFSVAGIYEIERLEFFPNGNGLIGFTEESEFTTNPIVWSVENGELVFKETDSYGDTWDWTFSATTLLPNRVAVDVHVLENEGGSTRELTTHGTLTRVLGEWPQQPGVQEAL